MIAALLTLSLRLVNETLRRFTWEVKSAHACTRLCTKCRQVERRKACMAGRQAGMQACEQAKQDELKKQAKDK